MLRIVTLNWRDYQGRGVEYTNTLFDSLRRNLPEGFEGAFTVFTDEPFAGGYLPGIEIRELPDRGLTGWWNKLQLFRRDLFTPGDRIVFLDLDTVVTGPVEKILSYTGNFAILRDFYRPHGLQSSVMAWKAGTFLDLWDTFEQAGCPEDDPRGDQGWIEDHVRRCDTWQALFPRQFVSYKAHGRRECPKDARMVIFHGVPRPHEVFDGWVPKVWKVGGGTVLTLDVVANVSRETIRGNIEVALAGAHKWLTVHPAHDGVALVCAGGPSLADDVHTVKALSRQASIFTVNGTLKWLRAQGVKCDYQVLLDARPENRAFLEPDWHGQVIACSQCDPGLIAEAKDPILFHPYFDGIKEIVGEDDQSAFIGGGTTAGLKTLVIAYALGYRKIYMFGFDSCYRANDHHAYPQALNDGEKIIEVEVEGEPFRCAPWMATQAEDFQSLAGELTALGAELHIRGSGLIPAIAAAMSRQCQPDAAQERANAILARLNGKEAPKVAEIGVFTGALSKRLLAQRPDLHLTMVDAWKAGIMASDMGDFHAELSQAEQDEFAEMAMAAVSFARGRHMVIRKTSFDAAFAIPDASLDLAFIDAEHSYEGCAADIASYWPKVKPGGILCGHDYANNDYPFGPEVKRAVDEFAKAHGLSLELDANFTWFVTKPKPEETRVRRIPARSAA